MQIADATPDADGLVTLPIMPMRGQIIFPNVISPITIQGQQAIRAARAAEHGTVIALALRNPDLPTYKADDLFGIGVEVALGRTLRLPDDVESVLGQGRRRVEIVRIERVRPYGIARARIIPVKEPRGNKARATMDVVMTLYRRYLEMNEDIPDDVMFYALNAGSPGALADIITSTLEMGIDARQHILEIREGDARLAYVAEMLNEELNVLELKDEISVQIQHEMDKAQREMYLREQMRIIQHELGEEDAFASEVEEVRAQIAAAELPPSIDEKALKELSRLAMMPPMSPEVGILRTYIDWLVSVPWSKATVDQVDVGRAQKILDHEHYGLPKVKDRILEYIAVRKLAPEQLNSPILCFVGPPGVGKTSLGRSIAASLGREFVRVSLGGIRDEAEIRGHRRTYIGALPGRIIQTMRRAGTVNPVFMLDEIDKLGADFRGDPSSALLEILDPEQNNAFSDHYLDVPYDLSRVLFITTANDLDPLPPALLDRLEVIEFSGYTDEEKIAIARRFLIPKQFELNGLTDRALTFDAPALRTLIREYTYEAGVRNLNREIASVVRKTARLVAEDKPFAKRVTSKVVKTLLGPAPFIEERANDRDEVGVATGLAWTPFGGDILTIEVSILPGKGGLTMTGSLGEVMQESAQAALSFIRARAESLDIQNEDFENFDVHVHLPEGAVPKDGPSAGITLAIAIISAFTERRVRSDVAMTGEITLRGKVLPVGGIKEKVLAARRARRKIVLLPRANMPDLIDIPKEALADLQIVPVTTMNDVLARVLLEAPEGERLIDRIRREKDEKDDDAKADDGKADDERTAENAAAAPGAARAGWARS
jgi:ATP-dependent Lon protease